MKHLGDITKINGAEIEPVECISFGSPCQDLSVAGKRAGLDGARSGLFMEAVRIIKEMRNADIQRQLRSGGADVDIRLVRPYYAIWENVPGAFSSNSGEDFRVVLEELAHIRQEGIVIPRCKGKWGSAGLIIGDGWSICWRQVDAQYWGVPQRRKRISLIMDFRGDSAGKILLEQQSLSGNPEQSVPPWKGIARSPEERACGCSDVEGNGGREVNTLKLRHTGSDTSGGGCRTSDSGGYVGNPVMQTGPDTFLTERNLR